MSKKYINIKNVLGYEIIQITNYKGKKEFKLEINTFLIEELQLKKILKRINEEKEYTFKVTSCIDQSISTSKYFKEESSLEEVLIGVKKIKNDIKKACNFNLHDFKEMLIKTLEKEVFLYCFTFLDVNGVEFKRIYEITYSDKIDNMAIDKINSEEKIDFLDALLDLGQISLSDIIDGIKNLLHTDNEMDALIYIAKERFYLSELIDEYNNYKKGRQIQS